MPETSSQPSGEALSKSLQKLALKQEQPVADSWEDEELSDDASGEQNQEPISNVTASKKKLDSSATSKPPPTSKEPHFNPDSTLLSPRLASGTSAPPNTPDLQGVGATSRPGSASEKPSVRPEKTVAPAARMIAGALGVRAPKKTEEQKAYDAAIRKQEMKRREDDKEKAKREEKEREQAKMDMWDG